MIYGKQIIYRIVDGTATDEDRAQLQHILAEKVQSMDNRARNGRPAGHSVYALPGTKKPARSSSRIVKELFAVIDAANISAGTIAKETGVHHVSLSRWKHGASTPMITEVENIASVLGYRLVLVPVELSEMTSPRPGQ